MATHSSILAWRIPWTEEPGGPQSTGVTESDVTAAAEHARSTHRAARWELTAGAWGPAGLGSSVCGAVCPLPAVPRVTGGNCPTPCLADSPGPGAES